MSETFLVPVRTSKAGALALRTGRLLTGERVGLAFTSEASLLLAMGPSQQWARLGYQAMQAMLAPLGIKDVRIDPHPIPELAAGSPDRQGQPGPGHLEEFPAVLLPRHMVPAFLEELPVIPMLPSGKADRPELPEPGSSGRVGAEGAYVEPDTPVEKALADELAELLGLPQVSVDSQFFDDLGMTSLMVTHFCALVRERGDAPPVSVKDVYLHPTIRSLAATSSW